jgi:WD40 repeat protein
MKKSKILDMKITKKIYFINFNQDKSCFCIGTDEGYELYNTEPLKLIRKKKIGPNGVIYITMLYRTNIIAFVKKDGDFAKEEEKKLIIYDDKEDIINATIEFKESVRYVFLNKQVLVVSLTSHVFIYDLVNIKLIFKYELFPISNGICALSNKNNARFSLAATVPHKPGSVLIRHFQGTPISLMEEINIDCHKTAIQFITFSDNCEYIVTSSRKGTLIRIFHASTGHKMKELRRGSDETIINWLSFSSDNKHLLCRSKKGTIHLFNTDYDDTRRKNNKLLSVTKYLPDYLKGYLPNYLKSEWSFAHFHFPNITTVSAFSPEKNRLFVISFKGIVYKINYNNPDYVTIAKQSI